VGANLGHACSPEEIQLSAVAPGGSEWAMDAVEAVRIRSLEDVLAYRNDLVLDSFTSKFDIDREEAEKIFVEVLRWLWYMAATEPTTDNPEAHGIDEPMFIIDEMWHTFILVTRAYTKFCHDMFGRYIHHSPGSAGTEAYGADYDPGEDAGNHERILARSLKLKRAKYLDIYQRLGEDVFVTWYKKFPQEYSVDAIYRLRKR
jgi:hypothetical protein